MYFYIEIIGTAPTPFQVTPMSKRESRFLWAALRYKRQSDMLLFKPDIPGNWLTDEMKCKEFGKKQ